MNPLNAEPSAHHKIPASHLHFEIIAQIRLIALDLLLAHGLGLLFGLCKLIRHRAFKQLGSIRLLCGRRIEQLAGLWIEPLTIGIAELG